MKSLRTRLFCGLVALLIACCVGAGIWAFRWSFDEAIELQDAILLQIGALALRNHVEGELPAQAGVDAEARIIITDIPSKAVRTEGDIGLNVPFDLKDGLHTLEGREGSWRVLVRARSEEAVWRSRSQPPLAMNLRGTVRYGLSCPCWCSYPVSRCDSF